MHRILATERHHGTTIRTRDDNGPVHTVSNAIYLGTSVTVDVSAEPSNAADGDDDDGLVLPGGILALAAGQATQVDVTVTNTTGLDAVLYGWIDLNVDGVFDESERAEFPVNDGTTEQVVPLTLPFVPHGVVGRTYARFRLSTDTEAAQYPTGLAYDGEVEDYLVAITSPVGDGPVLVDYGDAAIGNSGTIVSAITTPRSYDTHGAFHSIGDVDGDGTNDLAAAVLIIGSDPGVAIHLMNPDETVKRVEETAVPVDLLTHRFGATHTGAADLNGDGVPDVVVGSPGIQNRSPRAIGRRLLGPRWRFDRLGGHRR